MGGAGRAPEERDLYLERECKPGKEGKLEFAEGGGGIYVRYADIEAIAFRPAAEPGGPQSPTEDA